VLHLSLAGGHVVVALLIATVGAVLFGGVLGALQWLVVREWVPIPRRVSQSLVLRKVTSRWAWWIGANLASWLIVNAVVYLLSQVFGGLNVLTGDGSIAEVYLTLIATTPLTGRALLWVLAPSALALPAQPEPA
jgi:hypothetical protein